jgi:F0F1-type ATP synthase membrane subunit b/b'
MEQFLAIVKGILLPLVPIIIRAIPTIILVIILHWYLKKVLVQPLERTLEERRKKTQGSVDASEKVLAQVAEKIVSYEQALAEARTNIYRDQEEHRRRLAGQQAAAIESSRAAHAAQIAESKKDIDAQAAAARTTLEAESDRLADQIAGALLAGKVN